ncbi:hypothetical protein HIM_07588 [Hirsutella minnesotensis 3608]|uniref:Acetoacetate decarboxylase n=1 Tax=Hirsutella minnesotensis 3608 TaxID=1043627 RepID=A0A0F7ZHP8_9HYPO|nr:hypothetical protein HIM_07588 [Hirsutella minnesotensis 3608]
MASTTTITPSTRQDGVSAMSPAVSLPEPHPYNPDLDRSQTPSKQRREPEPIALIPPPWRVTGDVYCVSFWTSGATARNMPSHAYSPLEAGAEFANPAGSQPVGGLGMIQIIRYHNSPVGPYDEMLVVPGSFDWARRGRGGRLESGSNPRISRIYVSQKQTCYNGRINWGCPKHLARFDWDNKADGSVSVKVFPHDVSGDASEATPSATPFFQATFKTLPYAPSFPFATRWLGMLGFNTTVVMPPLPQGAGSQGELPGTDRWLSFVPHQYSRNTRVAWFDMAQAKGRPGLAAKAPGAADVDKGAADGDGPDNFWPGLGRWQLGMVMKNADVVFDHPVETWSGPVRARL